MNNIYSLPELKEELKPLGKMNLVNMDKEIKHLQDLLGEEEKVIDCAAGTKGVSAFPVILTSQRLLTVNNKLFKGVEVNSYERENIEDLQTEKVATTVAFHFNYVGEQTRIQLLKNKNGERFALHLYDLFKDPDSKPSGQSIVTEKIKTRGLPKVQLEILNGKDQLKYKGSNFQMIQENPGEVRFKVDFNFTNDTFYFVKYQRTENIKKSAMDIAGWTAIGSIWGNSGAIAGGLIGNKGTDKSTAAIFLVNKDTKEKIMLIVKCDSKILSKLSLFIPTQEDFEKEPVPSNSDKYEQLEKLASLKEQGILTEEEFQSEKEKILN